MTSAAKVRTARSVLTMIAAFTAVAPYLADWNATHIYNGLWPPHAKFHNAQTMTLGSLLGLATLFFTWRRSGGDQTHLLTAVVFASLYWVSQPIAFLFPGVSWTDPHLLRPGQSLNDWPMQLTLASTVLVILTATAWLARKGSNPS